jgi:hypothetical protein
MGRQTQFASNHLLNRRDRCRVKAWETAEGPISSSLAMLARVHPCFRRAALMSSTCIRSSKLHHLYIDEASNLYMAHVKRYNLQL